MLQHGNPGASSFLEQLDKAEIVGHCPCGCASFDIAVSGMPSPTGGLHILGDYLLGTNETLAGAFIFERGGVLAGVEVYGLAVEAPRKLPTPAMLRSYYEQSTGH